MSPDLPYHPFDRGLHDSWQRWPNDLAEGLLGRRVPGGATAQDTHLESGNLIVDALITDAAGTPIHVEFQTRRDRNLGFRMARYFTALAHHAGPPPEQHVVLLHPDADFPEIGIYRHGGMELSYAIHRLWQIDPERLLPRTGLLRLVPLAKADNDQERVELLAHAAREITERLGSNDPTTASTGPPTSLPCISTEI